MMFDFLLSWKIRKVINGSVIHWMVYFLVLFCGWRPNIEMLKIRTLKLRIVFKKNHFSRFFLSFIFYTIQQIASNDAGKVFKQLE